MIDWDLWQTAHTLAVTGSYKAAAQKLEVNATTIMRRKDALERKLGRHLFLKQEGQLVPTPACSKVLKQIQAAAENLNAARNGLAPDHGQSHWRKITITAVPYVCDLLLGAAMNRLPDDRRLRVELAGQDRNLDLGQEREADIALRLGKTSAPNVDTFHVADIKYSTFIAKAANKLTCPWVTLDRGHSHLQEVRLPEEYSHGEGIRFTMNTVAAMATAIGSGAAKGLLPNFTGNRNPALVVLSDHPTLVRPLWIIWRKDLQAEPHFKPVMNWVLQELASSLSPTESLSDLLARFDA